MATPDDAGAVITRAIKAGLAAREAGRLLCELRPRKRRLTDSWSVRRLSALARAEKAIAPPDLARIAQPFHVFASRLAEVQSLVDDPRLDPILLQAPTWGDRVWRDTEQAQEVLAEIAPAIKRLMQYEASLTSGRPVTDGPR